MCKNIQILHNTNNKINNLQIHTLIRGWSGLTQQYPPHKFQYVKYHVYGSYLIIKCLKDKNKVYPNRMTSITPPILFSAPTLIISR